MMTALGSVPWPPPPLRTGRLLLREPDARDRAAFVELLASAEVHVYLGGPRPREEVERELPQVPQQWPGSFVVDLDGEMVGQVLLRRADEHRCPAAAGKVDLGYLFLPHSWGCGYAAEACSAALGWVEDVLPGEPVVLTTQSANLASLRLAARLGFAEVERFWAWDAEQWLGERPPSITSGWALMDPRRTALSAACRPPASRHDERTRASWHSDRERGRRWSP